MTCIMLYRFTAKCNVIFRGSCLSNSISIAIIEALSIHRHEKFFFLSGYKRLFRRSLFLWDSFENTMVPVTKHRMNSYDIVYKKNKEIFCGILL